MRHDIAGFGQLFADRTGRIVNGQVNRFASPFLQILLPMALLFRSLKAGLICLIPNLAPLFSIFVVRGVTGIALDIANVLFAGQVFELLLMPALLGLQLRKLRQAVTAP